MWRPGCIFDVVWNTSLSTGRLQEHLSLGFPTNNPPLLLVLSLREACLHLGSNFPCITCWWCAFQKCIKKMIYDSSIAFFNACSENMNSAHCSLLICSHFCIGSSLTGSKDQSWSYLKLVNCKCLLNSRANEFWDVALVVYGDLELISCLLAHYQDPFKTDMPTSPSTV